MFCNKKSGKPLKKLLCVVSGRKTFCRWFDSFCMHLNEGENKKEEKNALKSNTKVTKK